MRIGITGGIGSGKSAVTAYLRKRGETVICADEVARQVVQPGQPGAQAVSSLFGDGFFLADGTLDRKKLGNEVFGDSEKRKKLEAALHPLIISQVMAQADKAAGRVFVDAALLIQAGLHQQMDAVWLITADQKTRIRRVMKRDKADEQSVLQRIKSQPGDEWMARYANEVIKNDGSRRALENRLDMLLGKYK